MLLTGKAFAMALLIAGSTLATGKLAYNFTLDPYLGPLYFPQFQSTDW